MDRNSIIGLVLIFVILVTFAYVNKPSESEIKAQKQQQDSIELVQLKRDSIQQVETALQAKKDTVIATDVDSSAMKSAFGSFSAFASGTDDFTVIQNGELKVTISNKGGRIRKVELRKQHRYDQSPLVLMDGDDNFFSYNFATTDSKAIQTGDLYFTPIVSDDHHAVTMQLKLGEGQYINQVYSLDENANLVNYKLNLEGMNSVIATNNDYLDLNVSHRILLQEKSMEAERRTSTVYYRYVEDEPSFLTETKDGKESLKTPVQWVSFKQQYFNSTIIADKSFENGTVETVTEPTKTDEVKTMSASLTVPYHHGTSESFGMKFYFGPNHYKTLAKLDMELERIIPMGWGIFRWVNKYIVTNVFAFLSQYVSSFGLIILILTLLIKTVLFPLVYRSYLSTAKMRVLKPEIDEIKEKHGSDMAKVQQENMKLYRKAGVNPLGGCVPVLLQLPILLAMFQFFPSAFELRQQSFLWAEDLSTYDSIYNLPFSIPGYGAHISLFALLMTVSSIFYTIYNNQNTAGITDQMKWISYIMPVVFLFVLNGYPAGLNYYYFLSNVVTIGQQLGIRRFVDDKKLHAELQENKKKPQKKSRLEQGIENIAKKRGIDLNAGKKK